MALKPYYDEDGITIYHGDCRDVLPTLGPVDAIVIRFAHSAVLGSAHAPTRCGSNMPAVSTSAVSQVTNTLPT